MADEPSLPPLPDVSWSPVVQGTHTRKRGYDDAAVHSQSSTSSDPAWFSTDDDRGSSSVDNYTHERRKRRYAGSWFTQHPDSTSCDSTLTGQQHGNVLPSPTPQKRTFQRQYDSGVWMGSDTATDLDGIPEHVPEHVPDDLPAELSSPTRPGLLLPKPLSRLSVSSGEEVARTQIRRCLENGEENIDLTDLGLDSITNDTIAPLSEFACIPFVGKQVAFEHKDPSLKLYLARNSLDRVPGAVFDLGRLSVLSLRANGLVELAPAVSRLRNLEELNVSQNALRYLPGRLLCLVSPPGKLKKLHIHPNPFCQPRYSSSSPATESNDAEGGAKDTYGNSESVEANTAESIMLEEVLKRKLAVRLGTYHGYTARILARSPVHYNDTTGAPYSHFQLPPPGEMPNEIPTEPLDSAPLPPISLLTKGTVLSKAARCSAVPSLMELSLLSGYKTSQLGAIPDYLSGDAPQYIRNAVSRAISHKEENGRYCCACGRLMIVPRTTWIEWWQVGKVSLDGDDFKLEPLSRNEDEKAVPFFKQGCSWKCVPKRLERRDWLIGGTETANEDI